VIRCSRPSWVWSTPIFPFEDIISRPKPMPKASSRPSLPTSSSDFALPPSSSASSITSSPSLITDEPIPLSGLLLRFRRPSLLAPKSSYFPERLHSPLAAPATIYTRRRGNHHAVASEESESDKDRMWTDSSPSSSSQNPTPPEYSEDSEKDTKTAIPHSLSTLRRSSSGMDISDLPIRTITRRLSFPVRQHSPCAVIHSTFLTKYCIYSSGRPAYAVLSLNPTQKRMKSSLKPPSNALSRLAANYPCSREHRAPFLTAVAIQKKLGRKRPSGRRHQATTITSKLTIHHSSLVVPSPYISGKQVRQLTA
jgi:hypothetical protein